jgi:hypothetical protein
MKFLKKFAICCLILNLSTPAFSQDFGAQRVRDVSVTAIERAIQCEIGIFATKVRGQSLSPDRLLAGYAISDKLINTSGGGIDIGFAILKFGGKVSVGTGDESNVDFDPYNINVKNADACPRPRSAATTLKLTGLRECLERNAPVYNHAKITCTTQMNVKKDLSGGLSIPWIVTFTVAGSRGTDYSYAIKVTAPAKK